MYGARHATRVAFVLPATALHRVLCDMQEVAEVQKLLNVDAEGLAKLAEREPRLLDAAGVAETLQELERLMPQGTDARAMLLNDTSILLSTQRGRNRIGEPPDSEPDSSYLEPFKPPMRHDDSAHDVPAHTSRGQPAAHDAEVHKSDDEKQSTSNVQKASKRRSVGDVIDRSDDGGADADYNI
jgi:hypothetical protein